MYSWQLLDNSVYGLILDLISICCCNIIWHLKYEEYELYRTHYSDFYFETFS